MLSLPLGRCRRWRDVKCKETWSGWFFGILRNARLLWNMLLRAIQWVKVSPYTLWRGMLMVAVSDEARKTTNGSMKSLQAVNYADWLVGNNSVGWSEYPYKHFGNQGNPFRGAWEGGRRSLPYSRESLSSVRDFCRQQAEIPCLTGDGLLIIHVIAAVRKRDFF